MWAGEFSAQSGWARCSNGQYRGDESVTIKKAHEARAQSTNTQQGKEINGRAFGLGVPIGPRPSHPSDPNRREDKHESLELPQFVQAAGEGGDSRMKETVPNGMSHLDVVMLDAEAGGMRSVSPVNKLRVYLCWKRECCVGIVGERGAN